MAKAKDGGKLHPLPFTTFGEITALGLKATVYCAGCYEHRLIDVMAGHLRDRCFATTRFRCTKIRYTGDRCGCPGSVEIEPTVALPVGGNYHVAFLTCTRCVPPWQINQVPIDQPPWSVVNRARDDASSVRAARGPWLGASTGRLGDRAMAPAHFQPPATVLGEAHRVQAAGNDEPIFFNRVRISCGLRSTMISESKPPCCASARPPPSPKPGSPSSRAVCWSPSPRRSARSDRRS
jgi:hypothetical protein